MKKNYLIIFFIIIFFGFSFLLNQPIQAQSYGISGWAWSENIGWISVNCTNQNSCSQSNYGVNIDSNGNFSGYAWSENIGWINFAPGDPYPTSPNYSVRVDLNTKQITGWARALAFGDGWDGWIKFGYGPNGSYIDANGDFHGWAWGSDVVGWLSLNHTNTGGNLYKVWTTAISPPTVDIKANGVDGYIVIDYNTSATISWTSTNASSCTISSTGWSGTSGSQSTGNLTSSQLYTANCSGLGGSASDSVTVFVNQPTLTINPASATLKIGEKKQFQALYDPDGFTGPQGEQDVTTSANWSSDNSAIAKVNNTDKKGETEGVAAGSTTIQATYSDKTATASIDVQKKSFWLFWKEIIPW